MSNKHPGTTDAMSAPRFMEVATFMRTPLITDASAYDVAMVGVPYDGAVTNRPGARHGPREIRSASTMMRSIHPVTRVDPYQRCRIGDAGDVPFTKLYDVEGAHADIENFIRSLSKAGVVPLSAGGDHSVTLPILRALASERPVGLVHIDAHTDTWDEFMGSRHTHGAPFRRAVEEGLIDPERTIQIGIRGAQNSSEGWDYSESSGMRVLFMDAVTEMGIEAVGEEARRVVGDGPTYISFDIDSVDPAFAPGTGTPGRRIYQWRGRLLGPTAHWAPRDRGGRRRGSTTLGPYWDHRAGGGNRHVRVALRARGKSRLVELAIVQAVAQVGETWPRTLSRDGSGPETGLTSS